VDSYSYSYSYSYSVQRYSYSNRLPGASIVGRIHEGHFEYEYEYRDAEYEYDGDLRPLSGAVLMPPTLHVVGALCMTTRATTPGFIGTVFIEIIVLALDPFANAASDLRACWHGCLQSLPSRQGFSGECWEDLVSCARPAFCQNGLMLDFCLARRPTDFL
jgi:hypothetical protein